MRILFVGLLVSVSLMAAENTVVVSPTGNLKTIGDALNKVRKARKDHPADTFKIVLKGGRYELQESILLTAEDSGLSIVAADGEKPVVSGGRAITNWQRDSSNRNLWRAELPEAAKGKWSFRQLFVNGQRKIRARTPNDGFFRIDGPSPQDRPARLKFHGNEIKPEWADRGDVEVIANLNWADLRMQIRSVDAASHVATLSGEPRSSNKENNAQYFVENAPEFLDNSGEWYLDTKKGIVSYLAGGSEDLTRSEVIAPVLEELLIFKGSAENRIHNIVLKGIEFSHTDWTLGPTGYADTQAAVAVRGELRAEFADDCRIQECKLSHLAGYGIDLARGCRRFRIIGNEFYDLGGGGIRIGEGQKPKDASEENNSHVVTDNHLRALGRVYAPAVGVFIMQSGTNRIAHNEIHDLFYTAISVGWNWGYQETPCRENKIEFNHLHDIGKGILSDMGAVYTLGIQKGTVIRNNLIHDVNAFTYGGWGLYTDEGSSYITLENNIVYACKSAGFHQHYGRENVVRNNIFAFNRENQLMRSREEDHISFFFTNNIVYFDSGNLLGSYWSNNRYVIDQNVYFDTRLGSNQEQMKFAGSTLADWRKRDHDTHSILADPEFLNPKSFDFHLQPSSPALKLGFKPIDVSSVGVRPKEKWDRN